MLNQVMMDLKENAAFTSMEGSGDIHHTICLDGKSSQSNRRKKGPVSR